MFYAARFKEQPLTPSLDSPMTPLWLSADANGLLKLIYSKKLDQPDLKNPSIKFALEAKTLTVEARSPIHRVALGVHNEQKLVAVAYADGSTRILSTSKLVEGELATVAKWEETPKRFKASNSSPDRWVGLDVRAQGILQSNQRGQVRLTKLGSDKDGETSHTCNVPMNLRHLAASPSGAHFAYGGTEVNLSLWSLEKSFQQSAETVSSSKPGKRGRGDQLFPGEIWRAKNVAHDNLDLRQPVDITSLSFLSDTEANAHHQIAIGNTLGAVHHYDTRKGKKPAGSWQDSRMSGGVALVEKGIRDHELYIADSSTNFWAIDLRASKEPLYSMKGLSGKVTSICASPSTGYVGVGALDRYFRLLDSPVSVDSSQSDNLQGHGSVVGKLYVTASPTAIIPLVEDAESKACTVLDDVVAKDGEEDDWNNLQEVSSDEEDLAPTSKKRRKKA
ncbi:hypothetical protein FRC15_010638 [Serendipita sp. 397]|nr:hypothetical protein FRC15_010638 [Serendipita sp. 397]